MRVKACSSNWLERRTPNPDVGGSSPSRPANCSSQLIVTDGLESLSHHFLILPAPFSKGGSRGIGGARPPARQATTTGR